jgi:hypothetical protein
MRQTSLRVEQQNAILYRPSIELESKLPCAPDPLNYAAAAWDKANKRSG